MKIPLGGRAANDYPAPEVAFDIFAEDEVYDPLSPIANVNATRVLILNASYEPLHVCSVKRAVALLMHGIAERVEDSEKILRSPSVIFPVPSVIRLRKYVRRPPRHRVAFNRRNVFKRDNHTCQYCHGKSFDLTLDHVVPRSRGGATSWENVVACCKPCNSRKRNRTPEEANMHLRRSPFAPRFVFSSAYGVLPQIDDIWHKYLPASDLKSLQRMRDIVS